MNLVLKTTKIVSFPFPSIHLKPTIIGDIFCQNEKDSPNFHGKGDDNFRLWFRVEKEYYL